MTKAGEKLIAAAKEATALARDEVPHVDGHGLLYWHTRAKQLEAALRGLMTRSDFWRAVELASITIPAEYDDCREALEGK